MRTTRRRTGRHPHVTVRLYPEPGTRYVEVNVWPTKRAMEAHRDRSPVRPRGDRLGRHTQAYCAEWQVWSFRDGRSRRSPKVAEVNVYRGRIGTEVVSHEMFHAAIAWGRRIRFPWARLGSDESVTDDEERLAYVHSTLCREFVAVADERGWYSDDA